MARTRIGRGGGCALLLAALLGAGVAGCSADEEPAPAETTTTADGDATATPDSGGTGGQVGTLEVDPADAVGEAAYEILGTQDKVTVQILPLEVKDDIMILRLVYTPHFADVAADEPISLHALQGESSRKFLPTLVDRENLKEYSLITETGLTWSADRTALRTVNEQSLDWWGVFAAPQDDIDAVDVRLGENWPEFQDVPIR